MAVDYRVDVLVQGYPGRALFHGGMGWSTIALLRGGGRAILVDVGAFGVRGELRKQMRKVGIEPGEITDVVLTHAHYDHSVNFPLFPNATIHIGEHELEWAAAQPPGFDPLPELYVQELVRSPKVRRIKEGEEFLPGLKAILAPGHTPGHMVFYLEGTQAPIVFTGDAAKNRAELLTRSAHMTYDESVTKRTIETIWEYWRKVPGTLLIPGHDLTMRLDDAGQPEYMGERTAVIEAWFGETMELTTRIDLCACSK